MKRLFRRAAAAAFAGGSIYGGFWLKKRYAPVKGVDYKVGEVVNKEGDVFVGYFGAHHKTLKNLDTRRPTFYAREKGVSQWYAVQEGDEGEIGVLVAKRVPKREDHKNDYWVSPYAPKWKPLSSKYMEEAELHVHEVEEVTSENRRGIAGYVHRVYAELKDKLSK